MRKTILIVIVLSICLLFACAPEPVHIEQTTTAPTSEPTQKVIINTPNPTNTPTITTEPNVEPQLPKYIFFLIGDGMGVGHKQISEEFLQFITSDADATLWLNSMNVNTSVTTYSADAAITDSAASATALASGIKTNNAMIGLTPDEADSTSLLDALQEIGYATGIVTNTRVTHATPACFYAHNTSRSNEAEIAIDLLNSDIDFIAGGGLKFFLPKTLPEPFASFEPDVRNFEIISDRNDERFLLDEFSQKGYEIFAGPNSSTDLAAYSPTAGDKVFAPLTYNYFPYEIDRVNRFDGLMSLSEITDQAIELLALDEDGFFLMVEGGRIDYAAHNNDILGVIYDTLAFDAAVQIALEFYHAHPDETLIITTSDHETGGLTLDDDIDYAARFYNVYDISASYGDGFGLLYNSQISFNDYISALETFGFLDLTESELSSLKRGYNADRELEYNEDEIDTQITFAANSIINARLGIAWSTDYHTSADVDLGVTGIFEEMFADATDNTDIANILAGIMKVDIGP